MHDVCFVDVDKELEGMADNEDEDDADQDCGHCQIPEIRKITSLRKRKNSLLLKMRPLIWVGKINADSTIVEVVKRKPFQFMIYFQQNSKTFNFAINVGEFQHKICCLYKGNGKSEDNCFLKITLNLTCCLQFQNLYYGWTGASTPNVTTSPDFHSKN